MRRLRVLRRVLKTTGAHRIWTGFVLFFLACTVIIWLREPGITTWGDAFWYCYAVVTTVGFGDVVAQTPLARILSAILSIYAVVVIAIVTGVIVNYFNELVKLKHETTVTSFVDKLERLPELSREELTEISRRVKEYVER